ncbi:hypothetical protein EG19_05770 [Thermoanaerobaculum aquaticum]|uniref:Uncharacterized protein n=1 Tax=Thermoanaerobaculum aquaticum TaxID=1312852 RepID=A0A062XY68_9BACT|nr:hypothetical protein EG19_05770 [Thermoanaerobaculum aquaticum]
MAGFFTLFRRKLHHRGTPTAPFGRCFVCTQHVREARQEPGHPSPGYPFPAPVNEAHLSQAAFSRFLQVRFHRGFQVFRVKGVEVEAVLDGQNVRLGFVCVHR